MRVSPPGPRFCKRCFGRARKARQNRFERKLLLLRHRAPVPKVVSGPCRLLCYPLASFRVGAGHRWDLCVAGVPKEVHCDPFPVDSPPAQPMPHLPSAECRLLVQRSRFSHRRCPHAPPLRPLHRFYIGTAPRVLPRTKANQKQPAFQLAHNRLCTEWPARKEIAFGDRQDWSRAVHQDGGREPKGSPRRVCPMFYGPNHRNIFGPNMNLPKSGLGGRISPTFLPGFPVTLISRSIVSRCALNTESILPCAQGSHHPHLPCGSALLIKA